jgi:tetratricopeptide (TPR) repeat protein
MAYMTARLIFFVFLSLLGTSAIPPAFAQQNNARLALLVGNADYPDAAAPLKDPLNSVHALAEELRRDGFEVDVGENMSKEAMRSAIERFYDKIKPGSAALFFFSGFGIQSDRQAYMVPVNAQIWNEADVRRDGYSLDSVLAEMNKRGARVKVAIFDASRRNPFERRFRSVAAGLAPVVAPKDTVVMYAAAPGTVVRDTQQELFMSELLKEIRVPGRIEEAFNRTLTGVSRASQGEQIPWFSSSLIDEFSLLPSSRPGPESVDLEKNKRPPAPPPDPEADARRDYQSAERIGTKKAWEDFVAKYPSGRYSNLARDQLAKLDVVVVRPKQPDPVVTPPVKPIDPAIVELDKAIAINANDGFSFHKRGQLYAKAGDFTQAVKDFNEAIRLSPKDAEALNNRCWARAIIGELQLALKDCNEALQIRPRYGDAFDSRGFVNLKIGQPVNALSDYEASLRINPKLASSLYGRGIAKLRNGATAGGNADIAAAKAIQPDIAEEFAGFGVR